MLPGKSLPLLLKSFRLLKHSLCSSLEHFFPLCETREFFRDGIVPAAAEGERRAFYPGRFFTSIGVCRIGHDGAEVVTAKQVPWACAAAEP